VIKIMLRAEAKVTRNAISSPFLNRVSTDSFSGAELRSRFSAVLVVNAIDNP
jgi:hypothetical protein